MGLEAERVVAALIAAALGVAHHASNIFWMSGELDPAHRLHLGHPCVSTFMVALKMLYVTASDKMPYGSASLG